MRLMLAPIIFMLWSAPAFACLPPPPGEKPPTLEQKAEAISRGSDTIVYGVLVRGTKFDRNGELRVIHVYKGSLRVGSRVSVGSSWGFDPPMCASMFGSPPPTPKGAYGVFAWSGEPILSRVPDDQLAVMFDRGMLIRAGRPPAR